MNRLLRKYSLATRGHVRSCRGLGVLQWIAVVNYRMDQAVRHPTRSMRKILSVAFVPMSSGSNAGIVRNVWAAQFEISVPKKFRILQALLVVDNISSRLYVRYQDGFEPTLSVCFGTMASAAMHRNASLTPRLFVAARRFEGSLNGLYGKENF